MSAGANSKRVVAFAVRRCGLPAVVRETVTRRRVAILVYHDPSPETLDRHLRYLSRRHSVIPLDLLVDALGTHDWSRIPPRSVVLTLDDGHRGNFDLLDVIVRHGIRPTIYLCSGIVGTRRRFWWTAAGREAEALKREPNEQRLARLGRLGFDQTAELDEGVALTHEEIAELGRHVDFGAHTRFHPILPQCDDDLAAEEIAGSKSDLEAIVDRECRHFSYPNGDYGAREVTLARRAGFASARTTASGWNGRDADPLRLRAIGVPDAASVDELAARLGGLIWLRDAVRAPVFRLWMVGRSRGKSRIPVAYRSSA